jgi:hypothetical protein
MRTLAALLLSAGAALAEGPPPEYFTGTYQRIGRDGASPPGLLNDPVRLDPAGEGLALRECADPVGEPVSPLLLEFDRTGEVPNLLIGEQGPFQVWCLHQNNGDNYPLLTCGSDGGARFTLWPEPDLPCAG